MCDSAEHRICIDDLCNSIIASCTKAANVTIPSCKPKSVTSEGTYGQMRLSLNVTGHFFGMGSG